MADSHEHQARTHGPAVTEQPERRSSPRYGTNADTEVEEPRTQAKLIGRTTDLAMGGCYVDALTAFPVGTHVHVRINRAGQEFEAEARVLYGKPGMGMGMEFLKMAPEDRMRLEQWTRELSGDLVPTIKREETAQYTAEGGIERDVLGELITLMMRKALITQSEGEALRRELEKRRRRP